MFIQLNKSSGYRIKRKQSYYQAYYLDVKVYTKHDLKGQAVCTQTVSGQFKQCFTMEIIILKSTNNYLTMDHEITKAALVQPVADLTRDKRGIP